MILKRLRAILWKINPRAMRRAQVAFQLRNASGRFAKGWVGTGTALRKTAVDWRTWAQPGVKLGVNLAQDGKSLAGSDGAMSGDQQDQALDGNR